MNCRQWVVDVILVQTPSRLRPVSGFGFPVSSFECPLGTAYSKPETRNL